MKTKITDNVKEMGMYDLMHNSFFIKDREVWYRDFEREISAYDLVREIHENLLGNKRLVRKLEGDFLDDEDLGDLLLDHSQYGTDNLEGIIAMFYSVLCGAAGVRAELIERREEIDAVRFAVEQGYGYLYDSKEKCFFVILGNDFENIVDWFKTHMKNEEK